MESSNDIRGFSMSGPWDDDEPDDPPIPPPITMSTDELDKLSKVAERIGSFIEAARIVVGAFIAVIIAIIGVALWVKSTNDGLAQTQEQIHSFSADYSMQMREISDWRRSKDEIDTRLTAIVENQQKQLDHIQRENERVKYPAATALSHP